MSRIAAENPDDWAEPEVKGYDAWFDEVDAAHDRLKEDW